MASRRSVLCPCIKFRFRWRHFRDVDPQVRRRLRVIQPEVWAELDLRHRRDVGGVGVITVVFHPQEVQAVGRWPVRAGDMHRRMCDVLRAIADKCVGTTDEFLGHEIERRIVIHKSPVQFVGVDNVVGGQGLAEMRGDMAGGKVNENA